VVKKIKLALQNPSYINEYLTRFKRLKNFLEISDIDIQLYLSELSSCWNSINEQVELYSGPVNIRTGIERLQILYCFVRAIKPTIIIETGVDAGSSSYVILEALKNNKKGKLYSIDSVDPSANCSKEDYINDMGWLIPEELKNNWKLIIGDSKVELPKLLKSLETVDIFFHDSLHTYQHMTFEFQTVFPYLSSKKLLLADDINKNNSFQDFIKSHNLKMEKFFGFGIAKQ